jgi:hypothetical protein
MKITIPFRTFGATALTLAAIATSCTTVARPPSPSGKTYLVGVAGGG